MLDVFSLIFVVNTKIIFRYDFVAALDMTYGFTRFHNIEFFKTSSYENESGCRKFIQLFLNQFLRRN